MNPNEDIAAQLRSHWTAVADTRPAADQLLAVLSATEQIKPRPGWAVSLSGAAESLHWPQLSWAGQITFATLLIMLTIALGWSLAVVGGPKPAAPLSPFAGRWVAVDASDGSDMLLVVSDGDEPTVRYEDLYASACAMSGDSNVHWVGQGKGLIARDTMVVRFDTSGCTTWTIPPYDESYVFDQKSNSLVDGPGNTWHRP